MLELKNLVFEVPADDGGTKRIIDDLSLTIPDDRFTVITGPNGGGKSTLAKLIMGIEEPTSGQILFNGDDITDKSITRRWACARRATSPARWTSRCRAAR